MSRYEALKEAEKDFEIIFVSSDRSENEFNEYHSTMPWPAVGLPFSFHCFQTRDITSMFVAFLGADPLFQHIRQAKLILQAECQIDSYSGICRR